MQFIATVGECRDLSNPTGANMNLYVKVCYGQTNERSRDESNIDFRFRYRELNGQLILSIIDNHKFFARKLGNVYVSIMDLHKGEISENWYPIVSASCIGNGTEVGQMLVSVTPVLLVDGDRAGQERCDISNPNSNDAPIVVVPAPVVDNDTHNNGSIAPEVAVSMPSQNHHNRAPIVYPHPPSSSQSQSHLAYAPPQQTSYYSKGAPPPSNPNYFYGPAPPHTGTASPLQPSPYPSPATYSYQQPSVLSYSNNAAYPQYPQQPSQHGYAPPPSYYPPAPSGPPSYYGR